MGRSVSSNQVSYQTSSSGSLWGKIWAFLNRDVRSFCRQLPIGGTLQLPAPVKPMTNPDVLVSLAFQRRVLDWRDNAHADITRSMTNLCQAFSSHVDSTLGKAGLLDDLFSDTADKALLHEFIRQVEEPMHAHLDQQETALTSLVKQEMPAYKESVAFRKRRLGAEAFCSYFCDLRFKTSERENIIRRLEIWMLGSDGLAAEFRKQATQMADKLIKERQV